MTADHQDKGEWARTSDEGIVPAAPAGSDARDEERDDDQELGGEVTGRTASDEPATEAGIDPESGDEADATSDGGPDLEPGGEPDLRDAGIASTEEDQG
jgi:hypothetical protein